MKMVDERVKDTTGSNFIEVRYQRLQFYRGLPWSSKVLPLKKKTPNG